MELLDGVVSPSMKSLAKQLSGGFETKSLLKKYADSKKLIGETSYLPSTLHLGGPDVVTMDADEDDQDTVGRPIDMDSWDEPPAIDPSNERLSEPEPAPEPRPETKPRPRLVAKPVARTVSRAQSKPKARVISRDGYAAKQEGYAARRGGYADRPQSAPRPRPEAKPTRKVTPAQVDTFYERTKIWEDRRRKERERKAAEEQEEELTACSFRPKINPRPPSVQKSRGTVVDRLYARDVKKKGCKAAELEKEKEEEFLETHTFRPHLTSRPRSAVPVRSRYLSTPKAKPTPEETQPELTFKPTIKRRPAANVDATPAHERLYSMSRRRSSDQNQNEGQAHGTPVPGRVSNSQTFTEFLTRQEMTVVKKQRAVEQLRKQTEGPYQPKICKASQKLVEMRSTLGSSAWSRPAAPRTSQEADEVECTFRPRINAASQRLRGRTATELSTIDAQKAEIKRERMREEKDAKELAQYTFRPRIMPSGRSRLNISDPDTYVERIQKEAERQSVVRAQAKAAEMRQELRHCTFTPAISSMPRYMVNRQRPQTAGGRGYGKG